MSTGKILVAVALLLLVNLPVAASLLTDRRLAAEGEAVTAEVVDARAGDGGYGVVLRLPESIGHGERGWPRRVSEATYDEAQRNGELEVRAVPDEPGAFEATGEVRSRTGLWMTLLGNVLIGAWIWVTVRRSRRRAEVVVDPDDDPDGPADRAG